MFLLLSMVFYGNYIQSYPSSFFMFVFATTLLKTRSINTAISSIPILRASGTRTNSSRIRRAIGPVKLSMTEKNTTSNRTIRITIPMNRSSFRSSFSADSFFFKFLKGNGVLLFRNITSQASYFIVIIHRFS